MRVWVDVTNSPHVLVFRPLIDSGLAVAEQPVTGGACRLAKGSATGGTLTCGLGLAQSTDPLPVMLIDCAVTHAPPLTTMALELVELT